MITTTWLRILRRRHHITLKELHLNSGFSIQYINLLEIGVYKQTSHNEQMINDAVKKIIMERKAEIVQLEQEYRCHEGNLLQPVEVEAE